MVFQGNIFSQWRSTDSFLWIHGKRALPLAFDMALDHPQELEEWTYLE